MSANLTECTFTEHPLNFAFQVNKQQFFFNFYFLVKVCPMQYFRYIFAKNLFVIYLKFKFNWMSYLLSGNPTPEIQHPEKSGSTLVSFSMLCLILQLWPLEEDEKKPHLCSSKTIVMIYCKKHRGCAGRWRAGHVTNTSHSHCQVKSS